jgi:predicted Zn-dependent protease
MFRWVCAPFEFLCRRWIASLVVLLIVAAGVVGGGHAWAAYQFAQAQAAVDEDRFADARTHLWWCLRLWPRSADTRLFAARLERLAMNFPAAAAYLEDCQALQKGPSDATQLEWLCLRAEGGDLEKLEPGLLKTIREGGQGTELFLEALARASLRANRPNKARLYLNEVVRREPGSARAWHLLGSVYDHLSAPEAAISAYRKVVELQPKRWRAELRLASLYLVTKQPAEARPYLQHLKEEHLADREVRMALVQLALMESKDREARDELDRLLAEGPKDADALLIKGQLECEDGNPAAGEVCLKQALDLRPTSVSILWQYYRCLQQQGGRVKEASAILERHQSITQATRRLDQLMHHDLGTSSADPRLLMEAGELFHKVGNDEQAVEFYYRALRSDPRCTEAHRALAEHFTTSGDEARAAQHRAELSKSNSQPPAP